jgi:ribosomal protein L11 methyltransferase
MFELKLVCPEDRVEDLSDALEALDALSVSVEDADAQTDAEQALFGEPGLPPPAAGWQRSRITALFPDERSAQEALALLQAQDFFHDSEAVGIAAVEEQDWVRVTQSQFAPVQITPSFWIVPSWHEPPEGAHHVIRLDPGLAFGTGTHPTTHMCLRWIAKHEALLGGASMRVLDYGCGSGILAIGAKLFGAHQVDAVDIDPAAVESTRANALANQVQLNQVGLPDVIATADDGRYGVVLANILASPLKVLAPLLTGRVAPGGRLVLAGILERQEDELKSAYLPYARLEVSDRLDGWILMTAQC